MAAVPKKLDHFKEEGISPTFNEQILHRFPNAKK